MKFGQVTALVGSSGAEKIDHHEPIDPIL